MRRRIEQDLEKWRTARHRKPLILNGARQVGKTYILKAFGKEHFTNTVYVNLENNKNAAAYFSSELDPRKILRYLEMLSHERILPGSTLIILDEIQACEPALTSLKYFAEEAPEYCVAAAGSLLGVAVNREKYSFPVGKAKTLTLFPMDFNEYLQAREEKLLWEDIAAAGRTMEPLPPAEHQHALDLYREYLIIGGMPASLLAYLQDGSFITAQEAQHEILDNYVTDMAKYASASDSVRIRACYNSLPAQLAKDNKKFQYKIVQRGGSATLFGSAIDWLLQSGIALKCTRVQTAMEPLAAYADLSAFKLYSSDVGLLVAQSGISPETVLSNAGNLFLGAITENFVAQQLAASNMPLYYWTSKGTAEVDFILPHPGTGLGIEVKKGEHTKSRSLSVFLQEYEPKCAIKLSSKNFGRNGNILSLPIYAVQQAATCFL